MEKLGIETLKECCLGICQVGMKLDGALEDGKLTKLELAGVALSGVKQLPTIFKNSDEIAGELKDLSVDESQELVAYIEKSLDLRNDKVEALIEKGLGLLTSIAEFIEVAKS